MKDILYGVKLVILKELDPTTQEIKASGVTCRVETAESIELEPVISEGKEDLCRSDEKILAVVRTPDLLYGYNLTLKDNAFDPEVASLIEGGKIKTTGASESATTSGYDNPMMSEGATMKPFLLEAYVANYEGDSIKNYVKITFNNCSGKAAKMSLEKAFYAPEFEVKSREATKASKPIRTIEYVTELPAQA